MSRTSFCLTAVVSLWLIAVASGVTWLVAYQTAPGKLAAAPPQLPLDWAATSAPRFTPGCPLPTTPRLLLFLHPHCPCSRASLDELSLVLLQARRKVDVVVVFVIPPATAEAWGHTPLWREATDRGLRVVFDMEGREARSFGARTSGQVLLYDPEGRRVFSGGITDGRGHAGDNAGRRTVLAWLEGDEPDRRESRVFGCPLFAEEGQ